MAPAGHGGGLGAGVGIVAWLATRDGDDEAAPASSEAAETRIVDAAELGEIAALAGHPVYWAGPVAGAVMEATEGSDGSVQVTYLEDGGDSTEALTVGTYPLPDPQGALDDFAARPGSVVRQADDGTEVVTSSEQPTSVYFVDPDNTVQVEVYDPSPSRALSLALSGRVRPAG